jgi:hypothetical protein|tara:strand:- start:398 stop:688 length:291 start_codon:yes stop_codon:yes gene_type:complete
MGIVERVKRFSGQLIHSLARVARTPHPTMLRVAALAALGVASVNAATIIETYPLTADCSVSNTSRAERICFSFASRAVVASRKASRRDTDFHCDPR